MTRCPNASSDVRRAIARLAQPDVDRRECAARLLLVQPDRLGATRRPLVGEPMLRQIVSILPGQRRVSRCRLVVRDRRSAPRALQARTPLRTAESDFARQRAKPPPHARHCVEPKHFNGALAVVRTVLCGRAAPQDPRWRGRLRWSEDEGVMSRPKCPRAWRMAYRHCASRSPHRGAAATATPQHGASTDRWFGLRRWEASDQRVHVEHHR